MIVRMFSLAFTLAVFLDGCGGGESAGGGSVKKPFGPFSETTTYTSKLTKPDGTQEVITGKTVGEKIIKGVSYARHQVGPLDATPKRGIELWVKLKNETLTLAGGQAYYSAAADTSKPYLAVTLDQPVEIDALPPVGIPQTFHVRGDFSVQDPAVPANPYPVDDDVTYTLEDDSVTVDTGMGKIQNCRRYTGSATVGGTLFEGELYYKPEIGPVAGKLNWPSPNGFSATLLSAADFGSSEAGYNTIQSTVVIGPDNPSFKLDTYDVSQQFDADKDTHAQMLLEFRWVDEKKAKETEMPYITPEFGTVWGIFPYELVSSPVSIFFPEENDLGFTYWMAYVDKAAKNESQNGIAYHVSVNLGDFISSQLRVTARIRYKLYQP